MQQREGRNLDVGVPIETRRAALQTRIGDYVRRGYRVVSQTDTTAQLVKPKKFSIVWFVIWLILAILPAVLYVLYHLAVKKDKSVYLVVDERGQVIERKN